MVQKRSGRNVPSSIMFSRFLLVAATQRKSTLMTWLPPTRVISRSCRTRSRSVCVFRLMSPISSRNTVPPSAISNFPFLRYCAPVKAPFSWPNNSLSSGGSVIGLQFMEATHASGVNGANHQLFAGSALAGDQDVGIGGADGFNGFEYFAHRRTLSHELAGTRDFGDGRAQLNVFLFRSVMGKSFFYQMGDLVAVDRLVETFICSVLSAR